MYKFFIDGIFVLFAGMIYLVAGFLYDFFTGAYVWFSLVLHGIHGVFFCVHTEGLATLKDHEKICERQAGGICHSFCVQYSCQLVGMS